LRKTDNFEANVLIRVSGTTSYVDNTVAPGTTYLYNVFNVTTSQVGGNDYATTVMFTDDPVAVGITATKAVHLVELRTAINAMRTAAALSPASWTSGVTPGAAIRAVHITELRSALNQALIELARYSSFTDPNLAAGMPIRAAHIVELREAVK